MRLERSMREGLAAHLRVILLALIAIAMTSLPSIAQEETFHPRMDVASWETDSTLLVCRVRQEIPFLGLAEFVTWSGGKLRFELNSQRPPVASEGRAQLWVEAPVWNPDHPSRELGETNLKSGQVPVKLDRAMASTMMAELYRGGTVRMKSDAWYSDEQQTTEVGLSPVAFRAAYKRFTACLGQLMPVGFAELERSKVFFASDDYELEQAAIEWLDLLASFVTRDPNVERVFIDGHTDNTNTTTYNIELSRQRAEAVGQRLQQQGVPEEQIVVRYHGERFPIESNRSARGKAANRRVTLRLEMSPEADLPS